ncbi:MAG: redox-active disulfide protein 2 [Patescibacteria group bacterium]|nr:MAG: redox-active disulfide protein 2 [Patescibacteria group bacterium]
MKVQVLGSGCPTCKKLYEITREVISELPETVELEYLTGIKGTSKIIELGAISSPVLAVDNKIAMVGFSPDKKKIKAAIVKTR